MDLNSVSDRTFRCPVLCPTVDSSSLALTDPCRKARSYSNARLKLHDSLGSSAIFFVMVFRQSKESEFVGNLPNVETWKGATASQAD